MSLPKFGSGLSTLKSIQDALSDRSGIDLDFIEIPIEEPFFTPEILAKNKILIKKFTDDNGMFLLAHSPLNSNLSTQHENVRRAWVEEYKKIIDICQELEVRKIVVHPKFLKYPLEKDTKAILLKNNINSLTEVVDFAKSYGITILLENEPRPEEIASYEDFKYMLENVKGIKANIDIGHAFAYHNMENIFRYLKGFRDQIDHLHFHDNKGGGDDHLPIGVGVIDYAGVVEYLKQAKYDKTITFEIFTESKDYLKMSVDIVKKMWG